MLKGIYKSMSMDLKLTHEEILWLIKQAELLQEIRNEAEEVYNEEISLMDLGERVLSII